MQQELKDKIMKAFEEDVADYTSATNNIELLKKILDELKEDSIDKAPQGVEIDVVEIVKIVVEHLENDKAINGINKGEYVIVSGIVSKNRLLDDLLDKKDRFIKGTIVKEDVK